MQNQTSLRSDAYLPFADGLRAVAILAVVTYHAAPWLLPGGFSGVDVFFVISGFLITRVIASEIENSSFSLQKFFIRRARRLMPAALVCFAGVTAISSLVLLPDAFWYLGRSLLAAVLMYANFFYYHTAGYFSAPSLEKPLLHTWTLAVEDQFYLTWPLLLMSTLARFSLRLVIAASVGILLASLWYAQSKLAVDPDFAFYLLPTRAWELLTGAILALSAKHIVLSRRLASVAGAIGIVSIVASFILLSADTVFPGLAALPVCLGTAAVIASATTQSTAVSRALSLKPVVFVGLISYSLYLWHWPLIVMSSYWLERPLSGAQGLAAVMASAGLAWLSWKYIEQPFRRPASAYGSEQRAYSDRNFVFGCLVGVAFVAALAGGIKILKGVPQRYGSDVRRILKEMVSSNPLRGQCDDYQNIFAHDDVCNFGRKKAAADSYDIAVFGDSMADQWVPAVLSYASEHELAGRQVTNGGCPLLTGAAALIKPTSKASECANYEAAALEFVQKNPKLKFVVISGYWQKWLRLMDDEFLLDDTTTPLTSHATSAPRFDKSLADTVELFTRSGIKVLLIGQIPTYASLPLRCLVTSIQGPKPDPNHCAWTVAEGRDRTAASDAALLRVAKANPAVTVARPSDFMCHQTSCVLIENGTLLYRNGSHLNAFGARQLGSHISFPELE